MNDAHDKPGVGTYLTQDEAKEFHKLFVTSFIIFTLIAVVAHFLVWSWKPWFHTATGTAAVVSTSQQMAATPSSSNPA
jgi:light-harvesting complex 1 beta chain